MKLFFTHWLPWLLYAGLIFYVSGQRLPEVPVKLPDIDKAAHFFEYGLFAFLAYRALSRINNSRFQKNIFLATMIITVLYGFSDELHQYYVPGREMAVSDFLFDSAGGIIVTLLLRLKYKQYKLQPSEGEN